MKPIEHNNEGENDNISDKEGSGYELGYEMRGWVMRGVDMSWVVG